MLSQVGPILLVGLIVQTDARNLILPVIGELAVDGRVQLVHPKQAKAAIATVFQVLLNHAILRFEEFFFVFVGSIVVTETLRENNIELHVLVLIVILRLKVIFLHKINILLLSVFGELVVNKEIIILCLDARIEIKQINGLTLPWKFTFLESH